MDGGLLERLSVLRAMTDSKLGIEDSMYQLAKVLLEIFASSIRRWLS